MKAIPHKKVINTLKQLGFKPSHGSKRGGHDEWIDHNGRTCHPVSFKRQSDVPMAVLYSLGLELENKGICQRRQFLATMKVV